MAAFSSSLELQISFNSPPVTVGKFHVPQRLRRAFRVGIRHGAFTTPHPGGVHRVGEYALRIRLVAYVRRVCVVRWVFWLVV